jgi:Gpi18-like mannosyltransferase
MKSKIKLIDKIISTFSLNKIILFALLLRLGLLPLAYHGDVNVNYWWGRYANDFGLRGFYDWLDFGNYGRPDLPMLFIYYCLFIRKIYLIFYEFLWFININLPLFPSKLITWYSEHGNQILLKVPLIASDIGLIFLTFKIIKTKINEKIALIAAWLVALYPPLIYNSAVWGSGDSTVIFLGLCSIWLLLNRKYLISTLCILASILFKPTLLTLLPFMLIILIKQKIKAITLFKIILFSLLIIYLISAPFTSTNPLVWFIDTYFRKILSADWRHQLTGNAMNFWGLIFGLDPKTDNLIVFSHLTARLFSIITTATIEVFILFKLFKKFNFLNLLSSISASTITIFIFMTRMHERYLLPAIISLLILMYFDKKYLKYFVVLSLTHMLNIYHGWWIPQIPWLISFLSQDTVIRIISAVNVIAGLFFLLSYLTEKQSQKIKTGI